ncbi:hypothetical protein AAMO2058_001262500 [Amorphochlora amoebiformis]
MGVGWSLPKFKGKLRIAIQRLKQQTNKKRNIASNVTRKEVITMLREGKEESARIRAESMLQQENLATAMEVMMMMCDTLLTRARYLDNNKKCPEDMVESCASVLFGASRMDIPELTDIGQMLGSKYSRKWAEDHADNESGKVNRKLVSLLDIKPPPYQVVLQKMCDIAKLYGFNWKPKKEAPSAPRTVPVPQPATQARTEGKELEGAKPDETLGGTINVSVLKAKSLYEKSWLGRKRPFVVCYVTGALLKSQKTPASEGPDPEWKAMHFPFHVPGHGYRLHVEVHNESAARDEIMAATSIEIDTVEPGERWYPLTFTVNQVPKKGAKPLQPKVQLRLQFMSLKESKAAIYIPPSVEEFKGAVIMPPPVEGKVDESPVVMGTVEKPASLIPPEKVSEPIPPSAATSSQGSIRPASPGAELDEVSQAPAIDDLEQRLRDL